METAGVTAIKNRMMELGTQCPDWILVPWDCDARQFIPVACDDPSCPTCEPYRIERERRRAARLGDAWLPVVERMKRPKRITLTIESGHGLRERVRHEARVFRRFLDCRLGPRNWPRFKQWAGWFLEGHLERHEPDPVVRAERLKAGLASLDRFGRDLRRYHTEHGRHPRMRDVIGQGFSSREVTHGDEHGWHVHRHLTVDSWFTPWHLLVILWLYAGGGWVVHLKAIARDRKTMLESIKYPFKPADVPLARRAELSEAIKGLKMVWPLGGARPEEPEPPTCKECGDPACRPVGYVRSGQTMWCGQDAAGEALLAVLVHGFGDDDADELVYLQRRGGCWREQLPSLDTLRVACHSEDQESVRGPP